SDLKVDQRVSVSFGGPLAKSKPPQAVADKIVIESSAPSKPAGAPGTVPPPPPAKKELSAKAKQAVAHLKKDLDTFQFTLWPRGNHYAEQGFKHLILSRMPPNKKPPDVVLYQEINEEQAIKLIDHLAQEGFFDRAVDYDQFPKDFDFGPGKKETTYAFILHT